MQVDLSKLTTPAEEKMRAQLTLIRSILGLSPLHDPVEAVRVLYTDGRDAMEKLRGPFRTDAALWKP